MFHVEHRAIHSQKMLLQAKISIFCRPFSIRSERGSTWNKIDAKWVFYFFHASVVFLFRRNLNVPRGTPLR